MTLDDPADLTRDAFLGGRVQLWQPRRGYRAGIDPVLLAAAVTAKHGERVLDLGCGAGAAALCLAARVPELELAGLETQAFYAALARRNAAGNGIRLRLIECDALTPAGHDGNAFDHVLTNPPFFEPGGGTPAADAGRAAAFMESAPLPRWIEAARRRLRPQGVLTLIQRMERLPELLAALPGFGSVLVRPLSGREGRPAERFLLRAIKGGRGAFTLLPPLILHRGSHGRPDDRYAPEVEAALREASPLPAWTAAIHERNP